MVSCTVNADIKVCMGPLASGFGSGSLCMPSTEDHSSFYEFIPSQINLCYIPFMASVELFCTATQGTETQAQP